MIFIHFCPLLGIFNRREWHGERGKEWRNQLITNFLPTLHDEKPSHSLQCDCKNHSNRYHSWLNWWVGESCRGALKFSRVFAIINWLEMGANSEWELKVEEYKNKLKQSIESVVGRDPINPDCERHERKEISEALKIDKWSINYGNNYYVFKSLEHSKRLFWLNKLPVIIVSRAANRRQQQQQQ